MRLRALAAVTFLACSGACSAPDRLLVFSASSLAPAVAALQPGSLVNSASSAQLALQIREGAPADVFVSASAEIIRSLHREGLAGPPQVIALGRIALVVPSSNPAGVRGVADLRGPGVRWVIGAAGVPVGDHARAALALAGAPGLARLASSEERDAAAVVGKVASGEADAGFVYRTDVRASGGRLLEIDIGPIRPVPYLAAWLRDAPHPLAARDLVGRLRGSEGRHALASAGFELP